MRFFPVKVLEMRSTDSQLVPEDPRALSDNNGGPGPHAEAGRRPSHNELPHTELSGQTPYTLNFSFEELNTLGLDEGAPRHSNLSWQVAIACRLSCCGRAGTVFQSSTLSVH